MRFEKFVLGSASAGVLAIAAGYLTAPKLMFGLYGITIDSVNEANMIRSAYGGVFLGFAALFAMGAKQAAYANAALLALCAFMGGFAIVRIVSLFADGTPHVLILGVTLVELVYGFTGAYLLWSDGRVKTDAQSAQLGNKPRSV